MDVPNSVIDFATAAASHQVGDLERAETLYRRILEVDPTHADAAHFLGLVRHQRGDHELAVELISQAVELMPNRADYRNNLGVVLRVLGRLEEAVVAFRQALRLVPDYPDALANLGVTLHDLGVMAEARDALEAALRLAPDHTNAAFGLGNLWHDEGNPGRAAALYRRAQAGDPGRMDILENLVQALAVSGDPEGSLSEIRRCAAARPSEPAVQAILGRLLERLNRIEEAASAYGSAAKLRASESHWAVRIAAMCPAIFPSTEAINQYRAGLNLVLNSHREGLSLGLGDVVGSGCVPSFHLAHHGRNDRGLRAKFAELFRDSFPESKPTRCGDGRPHIGFVIMKGGEGGFTRGMAGIVDGLGPQFRLTMFAPPGALSTLRRAIQRPGVAFMSLPGHLRGAAGRIEASGCDVLYHWQVDLEPLGYFLPFARAAPIQCTSWGTHATSGIPAMDYYLSSELIEPAEAETHYTEELVRLTTLPTFQRPVIRPDPPGRRSEFGLPEGRQLYACLQRLAKFHPDFDPILAGILRRDPDGLVILLEDSTISVTAQLLARLGITMPDVVDRVVFVSRRSSVAYLRLLTVTDVALDPLHYGSGLTAYDILGLGTPLVTLPGSLAVGRYAAGCYRRMELDGLAVGTPEEYIDLAVRLGLDQDLRAEKSRRILAASPALFDDGSAVKAHAEFFEWAVKRARDKNL